MWRQAGCLPQDVQTVQVRALQAATRGSEPQERDESRKDDWGRPCFCFCVSDNPDSQESIEINFVRCRRANAFTGSDRAQPKGIALQSILASLKLNIPEISVIEHDGIDMSPSLVATSIGRRCEGGALIDGSASYSCVYSLSCSCTGAYAHCFAHCACVHCHAPTHAHVLVRAPLGCHGGSSH